MGREGKVEWRRAPGPERIDGRGGKQGVRERDVRREGKVERRRAHRRVCHCRRSGWYVVVIVVGESLVDCSVVGVCEPAAFSQAL